MKNRIYAAIAFLAMILMPSFIEAANVTEIEASDDNTQTWYTFKNKAFSNSVLTDTGNDQVMSGTSYTSTTRANQIWRFIDLGDGIYRIQSRAGRYISNGGGTDAVVKGTYGNTNTTFTVQKRSDGLWNIIPTGQTANALHFTLNAQPYKAISWQVAVDASAWTIEECTTVPNVSQKDIDALTEKLESYKGLTVGDKMGQLTSLSNLQTAINSVASYSSYIGKPYSEFLKATSEIDNGLIVTAKRFVTEGAYALRAVSTFPDYNYASDGRYVTRGTATKRTALRLSDDFTNETGRWHVKMSGDTVRILTPDDTCYVYVTSTYVRLTNMSDKTYYDGSPMSLWLDRSEITPSTKLAWTSFMKSAPLPGSSVPSIKPSSAATSLTYPTSMASFTSSTCFVLIPLPSDIKINALKNSIENLKTTISGASKSTEELDSILKWAQDELDYVYLSEKDANNAINVVNDAINHFNSANSTIAKPTLTAVNSAKQDNDAVITVRDARIFVNGLSKGFNVYDTNGREHSTFSKLTKGIYMVQKDNKTYKIVVD